MAKDKNANAPKRWTRPELEKLGSVKDVAGAQVINNNGVSVNLRS